MEEHWAEFTHENQQKMPQKYVRVPSYLCSEGRERTECWKGSANFIVSCFLSASKSRGCWAAVLKYITKTPLEKNQANQNRHRPLDAVNMSQLFEV